MSFKKYSCFTNEKIAEYEFASTDQIERVLTELHQCFLKWKILTSEERQQFLIPVLKKMQNQSDQLAQLITEEMGKPIAQSKAEVQKCLVTFEQALFMNLEFLKPQIVHSIYKKSLICNEPIGVIYAIMPWNFPLWQVIRMIIPALLSGHVILLKHSEITPLMGLMIGELFHEVAEFSVLKNLMISHELTHAILADSRIGAASLTGSTRAGLQISNAASFYFKKTVLELGGSDPYLVFADADLNNAAEVIARSRLQNTGQSCIAAKRCLVDMSVLDDLNDLLKIEFSKYNFGDVFDEKTHLGPLADVRFKKSHLEQIEKFKNQAQVQSVFKKSLGANINSAHVDSEIYLLKENSHFLQDQEFFAPLLCVIPFQNESQAVAMANSTVFGLGAAVFTKDEELYLRLAQKIQAGQIALNDQIKSDLSLPFGGVKNSGHGRELGQLGFLEFTTSKVISF